MTTPVSYCPHCAVVLEPHHDRCPLCNSIVRSGVEAKRTSEITMPEYASEGRVASSKNGRKALIRGLTGLVVVALVTVGLSTTVLARSQEYIISSGGAIALISILSGYLLIILPVQARSMGGWFVSSLLIIQAYLLLLDWLTGFSMWSLIMATPMILTLAILVPVVYRMLRRRSLASRIAAALISTGVYTVGIDVLISHYRGGGAVISWSAVVLVSLSGVAVVIIIVHRTVLQYFDIQRRLRL